MPDHASVTAASPSSPPAMEAELGADGACSSLEAAQLLPPPWRGSHLRRAEGHGRSGGQRLSGSGGSCSEEAEPWPEKAARLVL